jgi:hypothetical protein
MISCNYSLGNTVSKADEAITLWRTEKGIVEIARDTLVIPVKLGDEQKGYIFSGHSRLVLDAIVETEKGAMGRPVEKEILEPFLMLGDTERVQPHLRSAGKEDLNKMGYENEQEFTVKAEDLFGRFFGRSRMQIHGCCDENGGSTFAFQDKHDELDVLVVKGSEIVYKSAGTVFILSKNREVLKSRGEMVVLRDGKSFVVKN